MNVVEGLTAELTRMVAERAALACGLELRRERADMEAEQRARGDFMDHLLAKGGDAAFLERWARHRGLNLGEASHRFFIIGPVRPPQGGKGLPPSALALLHWQFSELLEAGGYLSIVASRTDCLLGLIECDGHQAGQLAEELRARAAAERRPVWVGVSRAFQGAAAALPAYEECRALLAAMRTGDDQPQGKVVQVDGLGSMQLLFRHGDRAEMERYAEARLGRLIAYDGARQSGLVQTLRTYLDGACNLQGTADGLNISISGLKYRLQRIREVGGLDLADPEVRFDTMVALRVLDLLGGIPPQIRTDGD